MPKLLGINVKRYRYYDKENICVDFKGMIEDLKRAKKGSMVLL